MISDIRRMRLVVQLLEGEASMPTHDGSMCIRGLAATNACTHSTPS